MKAANVIDVLAALVTVALVTTIVARPESARIITALGNAFTGSLKAAQGR